MDVATLDRNINFICFERRWTVSVLHDQQLRRSKFLSLLLFCDSMCRNICPFIFSVQH